RFEQLAERDQIWVADPADRAELLLELQDRVAVDVAQRLERDLLVALAVERLVDDAHRTHAELADQLEAVASGELAAQLQRGCPARQSRLVGAHAPVIMHGSRRDCERADTGASWLRHRRVRAVILEISSPRECGLRVTALDLRSHTY